jgi:hypothetical protein
MVVTKERQGANWYAYYLPSNFVIAGVGYPKDPPQIRYGTYLDLDTTRITL